MLLFNELSFWERSIYIEGNDFIIIGSGIVGLTTSLFLKKKYPNSKILILERGYLPSGASTKNAGFACFGSPTELFDDLQKLSEKKVWDTFEMRFNGLKTLFDLVNPNLFNYEKCASWDLIQNSDQKLSSDFIAYLNENAKRITKNENVYSEDNSAIQKFDFAHIKTAYKNHLEGSIDTGKLIQELHKRAINDNINPLCI
jgi:glycine/D-amino acid oxidase-like deaminating enzyme